MVSSKSPSTVPISNDKSLIGLCVEPINESTSLTSQCPHDALHQPLGQSPYSVQSDTSYFKLFSEIQFKIYLELSSKSSSLLLYVRICSILN